MTKTRINPLATLDAAHIWHPYTQHQGAAPVVPIVRGEGALLYDATGRPIIDAISSWWVTLHGHAHPAIARAIAEQASSLEQVIFTGFTHEPAAQFASELCAKLPGSMTRVFYSDDGSTAVEVAIKMAMQYWSNIDPDGLRRRIITLDHAYHGDTFGAMSASAPSVFTAPFADHLFEVVRLPAPDEGDTRGVLHRLMERESHTIAAILVEPMLQGAGGMRMWEAPMLRMLRARTSELGILFIADECLTGFGRTGPLFACSHAGITPDIICLSKGITGGFLPLGATVTREEIFSAFLSKDHSRTLFHGHSYTGNPLACAAGRASLALLDDACEQKRQSIEAQHRHHLARLDSHPLVQNPRCLGTVAAFNLPETHGYLSTVGRELAAFALERGVLLRPLGNVVYVLPPYCITEEELSTVYGVIMKFLESHL